MKRALKWIGLVVVALVVAVAVVWYSAFGKNLAIAEGEVVPGVQVVKDGFVSIATIDVAPGKVALIDAGNDKSGKALLAALGRRNLGVESVSAIFLTHGHGDHTGGCRVFPAADVYALAEEIELVGDAAKNVHALHDGDVIQVGDVKVETFAVPGHTAGSAVYLAKGVLFFGDSAGASKDKTVMKAVSLFSKSSSQNVASLKTLEKRLEPRAGDIKALVFAHTGWLSGFEPLAAFAAK